MVYWWNVVEICGTKISVNLRENYSYLYEAFEVGFDGGDWFFFYLIENMYFCNVKKIL